MKDVFEHLAITEQATAAFMHRVMVRNISKGKLDLAIWDQRDAKKAARQARFNLLMCLDYSHDDAWKAAQ